MPFPHQGSGQAGELKRSWQARPGGSGSELAGLLLDVGTHRDEIEPRSPVYYAAYYTNGDA